MAYFEKTWIGTPVGATRRLTPDFPIQVWNALERSAAGSTLTTNALEDYHHAFNALISCQHPSVWKCNINPTIIVNNEFLPTNLQTPSRCQQLSCWTSTTSSCTFLHPSRFFLFQWTNSLFLQFQCTNSSFIQFQWTLEFITSERGKPKLIHDGYHYLLPWPSFLLLTAYLPLSLSPPSSCRTSFLSWLTSRKHGLEHPLEQHDA